MNNRQHRVLLDDLGSLQNQIQTALGRFALSNRLYTSIGNQWRKNSAVMFLIGNTPQRNQKDAIPCLILNKRSLDVRQPGDLCFPGGGITPGRDRLLARLLLLPGSPLKQWTHWRQWHGRASDQRKSLALLLAVALREAWEEMRLNPFRVRFMGFLPLQKLYIYDQFIHPMVGWADGQRIFRSNWEVQRILHIPLHTFFNQDNYARFQPMVRSESGGPARPLHADEFPCFIHRDGLGRELLWGATFRMVEDFLRIVFDFPIPEMNRLPKIEEFLSPYYPFGARNDRY